MAAVIGGLELRIARPRCAVCHGLGVVPGVPDAARCAACAGAGILAPVWVCGCGHPFPRATVEAMRAALRRAPAAALEALADTWDPA